MKKLFFFDFSNIYQHKNVKIVHNKLNKYKTIKNKRKDIKNIGYGSIIKKYNKYNLIVSGGWDKKLGYSHTSKIYLVQGDNEYTFEINKKTKTILKDKGQLCIHQCSIYDNKLNKYLIIGGVSLLLYDKIFHHVNHNLMGHTKECLKNITPIQRKNYDIISFDKIQDKCRGNGMYIMESEDLLSFTDMFNKPLQLSVTDKIINTHVIDRLNFVKKQNNITGRRDYQMWSSLDLYDTQPSFFYDEKKEKYVLYTRQNIKKGVRNVEFHTSIDCINWEGPFPISLTPSFDYKSDNIYYFKVKYYPKYDYYIGIGKYYSIAKKLCGIYLYLSKNGIHWKRVSKILNENNRNHYDISIFEGSPIISNNNRTMYFYTTYLLKEINIYKLRVDGYSHICPEKHKEGVFITKQIKISTFIRINSFTYKDGYVKIELLDNKRFPLKNYTVNEFDTISGDHCEKTLSWNGKYDIDIEQPVYVRIFFRNSNIYSLIY